MPETGCSRTTNIYELTADQPQLLNVIAGAVLQNYLSPIRYLSSGPGAMRRAKHSLSAPCCAVMMWSRSRVGAVPTVGSVTQLTAGASSAGVVHLSAARMGGCRDDRRVIEQGAVPYDGKFADLAVRGTKNVVPMNRNVRPAAHRWPPKLALREVLSWFRGCLTLVLALRGIAVIMLPASLALRGQAATLCILHTPCIRPEAAQVSPVDITN